MTLKTQSSGWLLTLGILIGAIGYVVFIFLPTYRSITQLRHELTTSKVMTREAYEMVMQIPAEEARLSRIEQYNTTWGDQMPATRDVVDVFGEINRIVSQSGSTTEEFTPGAPTSVGPLMKTSLKMTCKGTLAQIKDLLVGLERLPRTVWTEELRLTGASETGQPMTCQITLEVFSSQSGFSE